MLKEITATVTGRVQLVMYRDFTQRKARRFHVSGTVQNMEDGSVEVHAQGVAENIKIFIEKLHKGPLLSRVTSVDVREEENLKEYKGFSILF